MICYTFHTGLQILCLLLFLLFDFSMQSVTDISASDIDATGQTLLDPSRPMWERFKSLFLLKSIGTSQAINYILQCFNDDSELLKHECAYCLGQTQFAGAVPNLISILDDPQQEVVVRHEAGTFIYINCLI